MVVINKFSNSTTTQQNNQANFSTITTNDYQLGIVQKNLNTVIGKIVNLINSKTFAISKLLESVNTQATTTYQNLNLPTSNDSSGVFFNLSRNTYQAVSQNIYEVNFYLSGTSSVATVVSLAVFVNDVLQTEVSSTSGTVFNFNNHYVFNLNATDEVSIRFKTLANATLSFNRFNYIFFRSLYG